MTSMTMLNNSNCHQESLYIPSSTPNQSLIYTSTPSSPPSLQPPSQQQQRIAPKLTTSHHHRYLQEDPADLLRCKRRIQLGQLPPKGPQPVAVARRNERERNRVRLVNLGFATLRQHVPATSKNKKMSKVDTLRSAVDYIKRLKELLGESSAGMDENAYPGHSGQSSTGSPTPSMCSEASSPYELMHGDEEEELMDFANWF